MSRRSWLRLGFAVAGVLALALAVLLIGSSGHSRHAASPVPPRHAARPASPPPAPRPASPPPAPRPVQAAEQFGVNVNRLFNDRTYTPAEIDSQLQALQATGATIARSDALWEGVEPSPPVGTVHRYDWSFDDNVAASLARHRLRWLAIVDYSAPWARADPGALHSAPRSAGEFATFAAAFAARYGRGGAFWREHPDLHALPVETYEIWNEPDNGAFWQPLPSASAYADLYLSARNAIARLDAAAQVIVGGLTRPTSFLVEMLRARPQLRAFIDGVGIHPYGRSPDVVLAKIRHTRAAMTAIGLAGVPLYVTEFGWVTHPAGSRNYAPPVLRPRYISSSIAMLGHTDCKIAAAVLYTWVTPERAVADHEDWFGIHPPQGGGSPDVSAFAAGVRSAVGPGAGQPLCGPT